jgi:hypothetical protein
MMRSLPFQAFAARQLHGDLSEPMKEKECFGDEFSGIVEERIK